MSYSVSCQCGATHSVTATQAGSRISCACGQAVEVPALSSLRQGAGESPVPLNTIERIQAMIRAGTLPSDELCPYSGRPANEMIFFHIQCECAWIQGGEKDVGDIMAYLLLFGWFIALVAALRQRPAAEQGRETSLRVPMRISADMRHEVMQLRGQRQLKALLSSIPIYSELLEEFPEAVVTPMDMS